MRPPCRHFLQLQALVAVGTAYQGHVSIASDRDGNLVPMMQQNINLTDFRSSGRQSSFVEVDDTGFIGMMEAVPGHSDVDMQQHPRSSEPKPRQLLMRSKQRSPRSGSMFADEACDISKWTGIIFSCGKCKGIVGSQKGVADDPKGMYNDGPYGGTCSKYCAAQGLKCLAQQTPKSLFDCNPVWNGNCTTPGGKDGASTATMMCECEGSNAHMTTTQAPCVDDYDVGTVAKPWSDFKSCSDEKENCRQHPKTLQRHCRLTCGTCRGVTGYMKPTTNAKDFVCAGLIIAAILTCGGSGGYYYYTYHCEHTPREEPREGPMSRLASDNPEVNSLSTNSFSRG